MRDAGRQLKVNSQYLQPFARTKKRSVNSSPARSSSKAEMDVFQEMQKRNDELFLSKAIKDATVLLKRATTSEQQPLSPTESNTAPHIILHLRQSHKSSLIPAINLTFQFVVTGLPTGEKYYLHSMLQQNTMCPIVTRKIAVAW